MHLIHNIIFLYIFCKSLLVWMHLNCTYAYYNQLELVHLKHNKEFLFYKMSHWIFLCYWVIWRSQWNWKPNLEKYWNDSTSIYIYVALGQVFFKYLVCYRKLAKKYNKNLVTHLAIKSHALFFYFRFIFLKHV